jgi:hypothetical protein
VLLPPDVVSAILEPNVPEVDVTVSDACVAWAKVTGVGLEDTAEYWLSPAIVAVTVHVPEVAAVNVDPVTEHDVALPLAAMYVTFPPSLPPDTVRARE